ncbi:MAG: 6-bladed beta-propeller [Marinifilaceae bacterium]
MVRRILFCTCFLMVSCVKNHKGGEVKNYTTEDVGINPQIFSESITKDNYNISRVITLNLPQSKNLLRSSKIFMDDTRIYILDKENLKKLLVFDHNGEFLFELGTIGRSRSEFISGINDFSIDKITQDIYTLDKEGRKIIVFSSLGEFKEIIKFRDYWPYSFALLDNGNLAMAFRMRNNSFKKTYELEILNKEEQSLSKYRKLNTDYVFTPNEFCFIENGDNTYFIPNLCDTIYRIHNDTIDKAIAINFHDKFITQELKSKLQEQGEISKQGNYVQSIYKYFENKEWTHLTYNYANVRLTYLKNNRTNQEYNGTSLFAGFMPAEINYIKQDTLILCIDDNAYYHQKSIKENIAHLELWKEMRNNTSDTIMTILSNNDTYFKPSLIFVTMD